MHLFAMVVGTTLTHVSQTVLSTVNGEVKGAQLDKICWYNPHTPPPAKEKDMFDRPLSDTNVCRQIL